MPSIQQPITRQSLSSNFDEERWVISIRQALDEELLESDNKNPVHIFSIPPALSAIDPFSFRPQQVSIGPYHFSRPELSEMETYKVFAARRNQSKLHNLKLQDLFDQVMRYETHIRASYHKFLNFSSETLSWMMTVDACFLLEVLQVFSMSTGGKERSDISSRKLSHLVNFSHNTTNNAILRDIIMLENQIPLCVLRKLLELHFSSIEKADEMLHLMLTGLCEELSLFKRSKSMPKINPKNCAHLLDVLYRFVVPKLEGSSEISEDEEQVYLFNEEVHEKGGDQMSDDKEFIIDTLTADSKETEDSMSFAKPLQKFVRLPSIFTNKSFLKFIKYTMQNIFNSIDRKKEKNDEEISASHSIITKPPLLEEIEIPSVTNLAKSGIRFKPTNGGMESIRFDVKTSTFFLPTLNLDMNSPVILRNLVAYEACSARGPLVLARYTELMNGIIDTEEDAKFLREKGIIINRLKSDEEVTNLCNGMCKSIRLTKVPRIDKVIEDVNKFYNRTWKVKFGRCMKRYVFESWRLLTFVGAILMILFMGLQAFCSFCSAYSCSTWLY